MPFIRSAENVLQELGVYEPQHIDLEAIAFYLGAIVKYRTLDGCAARIIGYKDRAIISVDPNCNEGRKRFSIGHEIGHWMNDRGKGVHLCTKSAISDSGSQIIRNISEQRANEFSSDLLLPHFMLKPRLEKRDMTFKTIKELGEEFKASNTAVAIKSVKLSETPSMLVCFKKTGDRWFVRGKNVPDDIWPVNELHQETNAFTLLYGAGKSEAGPTSVRADLWINHRDAYKYKLIEHSMKATDDSVISLLWWKDESQLCDLI